MSVEIGNIACRDNNTEFQAVTDDGRKVMFLIPNEVILDFLGENDDEIDCPQFVLESTEIFEEMAEGLIARGIEQEPVVIDFQAISHYFN
jgi:hypothetical protein